MNKKESHEDIMLGKNFDSWKVSVQMVYCAID